MVKIKRDLRGKERRGGRVSEIYVFYRVMAVETA
jgi:hypothetical protein